MTTPDSHIPNSNAYPSGGNRGVQSYVPAPQGVPGSPGGSARAAQVPHALLGQPSLRATHLSDNLNS